MNKYVDMIIPYINMLKPYKKHLIISSVLIVVTIILYVLYSMYEGFDNKEACGLSQTTYNTIVKTMDQMPQDGETGREQINNGMSYRNMQSREIAINDDKTSWCSRLDETDKATVDATIAEELTKEVSVFQGGDFMDMAEQKSVAEGVSYAGSDAVDAKYAVA